MPFELTILGTSSATPTPDRHPSAQYLVMGEHFMMIDCGEGAQMQLMKYNLKSFRINSIFISHLHPDHYLGLPGLLSSLSLKGRTEPLEIYCPSGLKEILEVQFLYGEVHLSYNINFVILQDNGIHKIFEDKTLMVHSVPLQHRLPCWGFIFQEIKSPRKINKDHPEAQHLPVDAYSLFRHARNYKDKDGKIWLYEEYTVENDPPSCYAYITDTLYLPDVAARLIKFKVNLLYHEATFLHDLKNKALATNHSTAREAAEFAAQCNTQKLVIGHFSSRYKDADVLLQEAREVFPDTELASEGAHFVI